MEYTTLTAVKQALISESVRTSRDEVLNRVIREASRRIDRYCARTSDPGCADYFTRASVVDEEITGTPAEGHVLLCYPHKAIVRSVSAIAWRFMPSETWQTLTVTNSQIKRDRVAIHTSGLPRASLSVRISYEGGYANTPAGLPDDLQRMATILAVRFYREEETGLADVIGVAELGTLTYTQALPIAVKEGLRAFQRMVSW